MFYINLGKGSGNGGSAFLIPKEIYLGGNLSANILKFILNFEPINNN
jgi:hypothetical protein